MNAVQEPTDYFRELAARQVEGLQTSDPRWLAELRLLAVRSLQDRALPERKQEAWRYTSLSPFLEHHFVPCSEDFTALQPEDLDEFLLPGQEDYHRLVLVNGRFSASLSSLDDLPDGVEIGGLRAAMEGGAQDLPGKCLGTLAGNGEHFFATLNAALLNDGALIRVGPGVQVEKPIVVLQVTIGREEPPMNHPRHLVVLKEDAEANLIERFVSLGPSVYFNNIVTEIFLAQAASLSHQRVQEESARALHLAGLHIRQGKGSRYRGTTAALGAAWSRTELNVGFSGPGGEAELNGLYLAGDGQVTDTHLNVRHEVPGCSSREHFKGILDGRGIAVFDGRILVEKDAQQTDAQLANANLVLSRNAEIDTKPQLEIYADDVKCSHGTTVGQLDPDMLFYMRSRGIGETEARKLICLGFAGEVLENLEDPVLRDHTLQALQQRLDRSRRGRA